MLQINAKENRTKYRRRYWTIICGIMANFKIGTSRSACVYVIRARVFILLFRRILYILLARQNWTGKIWWSIEDGRNASNKPSSRTRSLAQRIYSSRSKSNQTHACSSRYLDLSVVFLQTFLIWKEKEISTQFLLYCKI